VRSCGTTPVPPVAPPAPLSDLANLPNAVFTPGEGFDTVQYAANGSLAYIFWRNRDLVLRERRSGQWVEQTVASDGNLFAPVSTLQYRNFQPAAALVYDSSSNPHIFRVSGSTVIRYTRNGATWLRAETLTPANAGTITKLTASAGPNGVLHIGVLGNGRIVHGTTRTGSWQWSTVTTLGGDPYWTPGSYSRRWFSMAVDSRNAAHFVYRPAFTMDKPGGYPLAYSQLWYANNRAGYWATAMIRQPDDNSGEVGSGMSVAIGPDDQPSIASWYVERGPGGSAQWSRLQYYKMSTAGAWARSEVLSRPDVYIAGDGEKGTGAQPYLRFDPRGRPHILFMDHASEHFPFQNEYAGHVRHAWWNGSQWVSESILRQDRPLQQQGIFPAFGMSGSEITVTALERATSWVTTSNPQTATSTYRFRVMTVPLK
jgi:hypothetical protein